MLRDFNAIIEDKKNMAVGFYSEGALFGAKKSVNII